MRHVYFSGQANDILQKLGCKKINFKNFIIVNDNKLFLKEGYDIKLKSKQGGFYLGRIKAKQDYYNINFFRILYEFNKDNKDVNVIRLEQRKAFLFVCGRDVIEYEMRKGQLFFVLDDFGNFIGVAKKLGNIYKNILDIGIFLFDQSFSNALVV